MWARSAAAARDGGAGYAPVPGCPGQPRPRERRVPDPAYIGDRDQRGILHHVLDVWTRAQHRGRHCVHGGAMAHQQHGQRLRVTLLGGQDEFAVGRLHVLKSRTSSLAPGSPGSRRHETVIGPQATSGERRL